MRCHAYLVRSERFLKVESAILKSLPSASRDELLDLLGKGYVKLELLSGEWRVLFSLMGEYSPVVNHQLRMARMTVAPDRLATLVNVLWKHEIHDRWVAVAHGLTNLTYALPLASGLIGVVFLEESEDWLMAEPTYEMIALRPDVFSLLEPHMRRLLEVGDFTGLVRLASDHAESSVEFTAARWLAFRESSSDRAPGLLDIVDGRISTPADYPTVLSGFRRMLDPQEQPSLDSCIRVHFGKRPHALLFRDIRLERPAARSTLPTVVTTALG